MKRRHFLTTVAASSGALALPLLSRFSSRARAGVESGPRRIIMVTYPMGLAMQHWRPSATGTAFTLPHITAPLEAFRDRCLFVSNVDNQVCQLVDGGTWGHPIKQESALTGTLTMSAFGGARRNVADDIVSGATVAAIDQANGPSICSVVGQAIRTPAHVRGSVSLGVDGSPVARWGPTKVDRASSNFFFEAAGTPAEIVCNPGMAFTELFGGLGAPMDDPATVARRVRRRSILDSVRGSFTDLRSSLHAQDRAQLDLHASYLRDLELDLGTRALCSAPTDVYGGDYGSATMVDLARYQVRSLAHAMACDMAPVGRLDFIGQQGPLFGVESVDALQREWDMGDGVLDGNPTWHGIVHSGTDGPGGSRSRPADPFDPAGAFLPGLLDGYRFFVQQFADLLAELDRFVEGPDGRTVLDNSLVVLASDMGDGAGHGPFKMGYILAGNLGDARTGYHFDASMPGRTGWYDGSAYNSNHVLTTIARIFGLRDEAGAELDRFGLGNWEGAEGTLPVFG